MSEPVFLVAAAIVAGTLLMIVKTIAAAFTDRRASPSELARLREQFDHYAALMDETQATLAAQSAQLAELQERLDFAERLLSQARHRPAVGPGETGG
jgi:chromosome segregation ATPase